MKFYIARENGRRFLHHRKDEAKAQDKDFEQIDIPTDMPGLKTFVQALYTQVDELTDDLFEPCDHDWGGPPSLGAECLKCGTQCEEPVNADGTLIVESNPEGYAEKSVRFEDEFDNMSLALQLHYAARAMENARERL